MIAKLVEHTPITIEIMNIYDILITFIFAIK